MGCDQNGERERKRGCRFQQNPGSGSESEIRSNETADECGGAESNGRCGTAAVGGGQRDENANGRQEEGRSESLTYSPLDKLPPPLVLAIRCVADFEQANAVRALLPFRDNSFKIVFAGPARQSRPIVIEMPGQQDARMVADDALQNGFAFRKRHGGIRAQRHPNIKRLPHWSPYTPTQRATMIFDNECRAVNDPNRQERLAIQSVARG